MQKWAKGLWRNVKTYWGGGGVDEMCTSYEIKYAVKHQNISTKLLRNCSYLASKACVCKLLKHFPNSWLDFEEMNFVHGDTLIHR